MTEYPDHTKLKHWVHFTLGVKLESYITSQGPKWSPPAIAILEQILQHFSPLANPIWPPSEGTAKLEEIMNLPSMYFIL